MRPFLFVDAFKLSTHSFQRSPGASGKLYILIGVANRRVSSSKTDPMLSKPGADHTSLRSPRALGPLSVIRTVIAPGATEVTTCDSLHCSATRKPSVAR